MTAIQGAPLAELPMLLSKVADLIVEGDPYLCLSRSKKGENFIELWCDHNEATDRWLIFDVSDEMLEEYLGGKVTLLSLVKTPQSGLVYVVDVSHQADQRSILVSSPIALPLNYFPGPNSIYRDSPIPARHGKRRFFKLAIAGDWKFSQWGEFFRAFEDVYDVITLFQQKPANLVIPDCPYNDGFSSRNFYDFIKRENVRSEKHLAMLGVVYSSPGAVNCNIDGDSLDALTALLKNLTVTRKAYSIYKNLERDMHLLGLRAKDVRSARVSSVDDATFGKSATLLLDELRIPNPEFLLQISPKGYTSAKLAMAIYRLIHWRLKKFFDGDLVSLPSIQ